MIDYASTAAKKVSTIVFGLASATLLARYLGPEGRGDYAIVVSFSAILFNILNFGVSNYYTYERRLSGQSLARSYVPYFFTLFALLLSVGAFWWTASEGKNLYALGAMLAAFSLFRLQAQSVLLVEDIRGATVAAILGAVTETLLLLICYLLLDRYVLLAVGALVAKELIILAASLFRLRKFAGERRSVWPIGARLLADGKLKGVLAVSALTALITINYKVDALILAFLGVPTVQIGIYALGVALAEYLWVVSDIFKDVQISRAARGATLLNVAVAVRMAMALTLAVYVGFLAVGWFVVGAVFGEAFSLSYYITVATLGATIFVVPCKIIGVCYIALGRFGFYASAMALAVVTNVALNFMLIPIFGIYGAVMASVVSYGLAGVWMVVDFVGLAAIPIGQVLIVQRSDIAKVAKILRGRMKL